MSCGQIWFNTYVMYLDALQCVGLLIWRKNCDNNLEQRENYFKISAIYYRKRRMGIKFSLPGLQCCLLPFPIFFLDYRSGEKVGLH
jgi:hypothetical protein